MENLNRPANPQPIAFCGDNTTAQTAWGVHEDFAGFTKLELASLMIAKGMSANSQLTYNDPYKDIPEQAVKLAKAVLEQANK